MLSKQFPKSDKLGLGAEIAKIILNTHELTISATLITKENKENKIPLLQTIRGKTEVLKKLIRLLFELKIINDKKYFTLQCDLQEISKDATNWQASIFSKELKI